MGAGSSNSTNWKLLHRRFVRFASLVSKIKCLGYTSYVRIPCAARRRITGAQQGREQFLRIRFITELGFTCGNSPAAQFFSLIFVKSAFPEARYSRRVLGYAADWNKGTAYYAGARLCAASLSIP